MPKSARSSKSNAIASQMNLWSRRKEYVELTKSNKVMTSRLFSAIKSKNYYFRDDERKRSGRNNCRKQPVERELISVSRSDFDDRNLTLGEKGRVKLLIGFAELLKLNAARS